MNIALNTPNSYWEGMAFNVANTDGNTGAINLTLNNGGVWVPWMSSTPNRTDITGSALPLESNLTGTVSIASHDDKPSYIAVVSANGKTLEGDIEWQANNNGQGRYAPGTLGRADTNHTNNGNTNTSNTNGVNNSSNNHTSNGAHNVNTNGNRALQLVFGHILWLVVTVLALTIASTLT